MREEEKIRAGVLFSPADPELKAIKLKTHNLNVDYNNTYEDEEEKRTAILSEIIGEVGKGCRIQGPIAFHYGKHTKIGDNFFGNFNLTIQDDAEVTIGDNCNFGPNVTIVTPVHPMLPDERREMLTADGQRKHLCYAKPVHIGNDCWFGASVTVCPGVNIGNNCVIGAGSVVTRDIPDNSFAAGVPCRVIRELTNADSMVHHPEILADNSVIDCELRKAVKKNVKVGIIFAADVELEPFLDHIENVSQTHKAMLTVHEGNIGDVKVAVLFSGVCKVNAAVAAQVLIDTYNVDIVINCGTAGGMDPSLNIFDTVIATEVCYHDVNGDILTEFHPWKETSIFESDAELLNLSYKAAEKTNYNVFWGRMVTGEAFISDSGRDIINEKYKPLSVDMETTAIAHVCYVNNIPFIAIRTITDTAEHSGSANFEINCKKASVIAKDVTLALLNELRDCNK